MANEDERRWRVRYYRLFKLVCHKLGIEYSAALQPDHIEWFVEQHGEPPPPQPLGSFHSTAPKLINSGLLLNARIEFRLREQRMQKQIADLQKQLRCRDDQQQAAITALEGAHKQKVKDLRSEIRMLQEKIDILLR